GSIERKYSNHSDIDNNDFLNTDYTTTTTTTTNLTVISSSSNNKIQVKTNDTSPIHNIIVPLENDIISNDNQLVDPKYKYHYDIDYSKHINDSCDDVKKWWRSQLYPNLQAQQHQAKQSWIQSNIHHSNPVTSINTLPAPPPPPPTPSTTVMNEEMVTILNSPKTKQQRGHKNQPRIISSLASKRRSGVAAVISRRPYQQTRVNNLFDVTIDEYTNDHVENSISSSSSTTTNTTIHNNNRPMTSITNRMNTKRSHLLQ
ncbi:unnamed protein product, partial [Schistosoma rodhaini]